MKVEAWVATDRVGSKMKFDVEIDDEELEGQSEEERLRLIDGDVFEQVTNRIAWGWNPIT